MLVHEESCVIFSTLGKEEKHVLFQSFKEKSRRIGKVDCGGVHYSWALGAWFQLPSYQVGVPRSMAAVITGPLALGHLI